MVFWFGSKKGFLPDNYQRSNAVLEIEFQPSIRCREIARRILKEDITNRQRGAAKLLDQLSKSARISTVKVKISNTRQWHKKRGGRTVFKQYGYYRPKTRYVYISNHTAVRGRVVAVRTFLNTLLHEWMHHYDYQKLKLYSIHSKGFYLRLTSLKSRIGF